MAKSNQKHIEPGFIVTTSLLYGIFVSERSYLIGVCNLVRLEHAKLLAMKVAGSHLPQELVDKIADQLYELKKQTVRSRWRASSSYDDNAEHFTYWEPPVSRAEKVALQRIKDTSVSVAKVHVDRASTSTLTGEKGSIAHYMHLSFGHHRPSTHMNMPYQRIQQSGAPFGGPVYYQGDLGNTLAGIEPGKTASSLEKLDQPGFDKVQYEPDYRLTQAEREDKRMMQASRLIGCSGVKEAMMNWDGGAIKAFVDLLELYVVAVDDGDPLEPGLHMLQGIFDIPGP